MSKQDSFIRWQNITINQLGFVNNLIVVLAIGLIGYSINFIQNEKIILISVQKVFFWIGGILLLSSITLGILTSINRLRDFKLTAKIARKRESKQLEDIEENREKSKELGIVTWSLLISQIITFGIGFILTLITVIIEYFDKIT